MRKMLVGLSLFLVLPLAQAQTYLNATGSPTFNTPEAVELGYVNLANGNLHLAVPFGSWPQRGAIGLSAGMVYDSRIWQIVDGQWQPVRRTGQYRKVGIYHSGYGLWNISGHALFFGGLGGGIRWALRGSPEGVGGFIGGLALGAAIGAGEAAYDFYHNMSEIDAGYMQRVVDCHSAHPLGQCK